MSPTSPSATAPSNRSKPSRRLAATAALAPRSTSRISTSPKPRPLGPGGQRVLELLAFEVVLDLTVRGLAHIDHGPTALVLGGDLLLTVHRRPPRWGRRRARRRSSRAPSVRRRSRSSWAGARPRPPS